MRWIVLVIMVAGCAERGEDESSQRAAAVQPGVPSVRRVAVSGFELVPGRPGAFDVRAAEGWPGRALDPVLIIGELRFHEYEFPARDTIRFAIPDTAALPDGAAVFLQFGDEDASRVVITQALAVRP
jgi:hypothetical protein